MSALWPKGLDPGSCLVRLPGFGTVQVLRIRRACLVCSPESLETGGPFHLRLVASRSLLADERDEFAQGVLAVAATVVDARAEPMELGRKRAAFGSGEQRFAFRERLVETAGAFEA